MNIDKDLNLIVCEAEKAYFDYLPVDADEKFLEPVLELAGDYKVYKTYYANYVPRSVWSEVLDAAEAAGYDVDHNQRSIMAKGEPYVLTDEEYALVRAYMEDPCSIFSNYETEIDYLFSVSDGLRRHPFDAE